MDPQVLQDMITSWLMPSFLSAVVAFMLGLIWYHPRVLGGRWLEAREMTSDDLKRGATPFILSFPLWFLTSLFFTFMLIYMNINSGAEIFLSRLNKALEQWGFRVTGVEVSANRGRLGLDGYGFSMWLVPLISNEVALG